MPRVTVCVPTYNRSTRLRATLDSVLTQTFSDWELLIVDDGSTDDTGDVAREYAGDDRIRCLRQENAGHSRARNAGLEQASGEYLAFLDHDDRWLPQKLERQVAALEKNTGAGLVYCRWEKIDEEGTVLGPDPRWEGSGRLYKRLLIESNFLCSMSVPLMRTTLVRQVGGFRAETGTADDLDLFLRLALTSDFIHLPEVLVQYNVGNAAQQTRDAARVQRCQWTCLRQCFQPGRPRLDAAEMREFRTRWELIFTSFLRDAAWRALRAGEYADAWRDYADLLKLRPSELRDPRLIRDLLSLARRSLLHSVRRHS